MYLLFETVCVIDGKIMQIEEHKHRFQTSYRQVYLRNPHFGLFDNILIPKPYQKGRVKLKIRYNERGKDFQFEPYRPREIRSLKVVHKDNITYDLKYCDRTCLDELTRLKDNCDDILIVKEGQITDCSFGNILFFDGKEWLTPAFPLLLGTKRHALLKRKIIRQSSLTLSDLSHFQSFQLINAMRDFDKYGGVPISGIIIPQNNF